MAIINIRIIHKIRDFYAAAAHEKHEAIQHYIHAYNALGDDFVVANLDALTAVEEEMVASMREEEKKLQIIDSYIAIRNQPPTTWGMLRKISAERSEEIKKQFSSILEECLERCPKIFKEEV